MDEERAEEDESRFDLTNKLDSRNSIAELLRQKRRTNFPTVSALVRHMGLKPNGGDYQRMCEFERGRFPSEGNQERFVSYMSSIGIKEEEQRTIQKAIKENEEKEEASREKLASSTQIARSVRGSSRNEYSDKAQPPRYFDHLHGRPGNWILQRGREGFGVMFGPETYEAMKQGFAASGSEEMSLDEVLAYVHYLAGLYDGLAHNGRALVDAVKKEDGVERHGIRFKHTLEDYAKFMSATDFSGLTIDMQFSLLLPEYFRWKENLSRVSNSEDIPLLEVTHDREREETVECAKARLLLLKAKGYFAATMAMRILDESRSEYNKTAVELRDLAMDTGRYLVSHRDELVQPHSG